ncbi:peroxisomal copper amine oxidase [Auriculariales sp. MPI-PUGE-AT-0066]|nr:peroxisomal copper amine oxidase [Auriculariales sp. MPI-PUGE-AT-0066]
MIDHPLDPLSRSEISSISLAIRTYVVQLADKSIRATKFVTCALVPPPKRAVLAFLGIPITPGEKPEPPPSQPLVRRANVDFIDPVKGNTYTAYLVLNDQTWAVESIEKLPEHVHPQITVEELIACEDALRADKRIIEIAAEIGLKPDQIFADGWAIGYDDRYPQKRRVQQCLIFARIGENKDENFYAHPLDFFPVLDSNTFEVLHVDFAAARKTASLDGVSTVPPPLSQDQFQAAGRERIPPPLQNFEYLSDLFRNKPVRKDLKPLHVVQPDGVSFTLEDHVLSWQKWKMHVAFSPREGIALSAVTYNDDGELRPLFYRIGLAEMVVPYGEPIHPHPRKFAFDVGEYGIGTQAMELSLGCDCLGTIAYMPGYYIGHSGEPVVVENAICIHEEDAGILWKHADFRIGGRAASVRSRRLVVSMICTVANYEYCMYYQFQQDGTINLEIRMTGILNVYVTPKDALPESEPHGTIVAPQITAHYHQHLFSLRIDPMIDGLSNTVLESDVVADPELTGTAENWAGNAFRVQTKTLASLKDGDGGRLYDSIKDRRWRIVNRGRTHYASGAPVGYVLHGVKGIANTLLAKPDSIAARRASFASKTLWVVPEQEDPRTGESHRMWPAGRYVPQTRGEMQDVVDVWAKDEIDDSIADQDLVLFLTFGATHIPRPEDFPVMPAEQIIVSLKPWSFFKVNPALDVPSAKDTQSVRAFPTIATGHGHVPSAVEEAAQCCS